MGRIIVACNDERNRRDLCVALELQGHHAIEATTERHAIAETQNTTCDVLIVDSAIWFGAERTNGFDNIDLYAFCRKVRSYSDLGIVILIRNGAEQSRIDVLNAGADDYLPEQFTLPELMARVRAIIRRIRALAPAGTRITLQDRAIDLASRKIQGPGDRVTPLTPKEFLVLQRLIGAGKPVTNQELARAIWNRDDSGDFEYVRTVVSQLRRKLDPKYIVTKRAVGYRFTIPPADVLSPRRNDSPAMAL